MRVNEGYSDSKNIDKSDVKSSIRNYLFQQKNVIFALIYGSFITEKAFRDIDIAIFTGSDRNLLRLGKMKAELSKLTQTETDLIYLNNLYSKDPAFAYEVVKKGELIVNKRPEIFINFKKRVLLNYIDTQKLREMMDQAYLRRLHSKKFGQRNYE